MRRELKPHQVKAIETIDRCKGRAGLFMSPGTGKTLTAIRYCEKQKLKKILVICRRDDYLTWRLELGREGVSCEYVHEVEKGNDPMLSPRNLGDMFNHSKTQVVIVSYDLVKNKNVFDFIKAVKWDMTITDECHYIKKWKTPRTKKVIKATCHSRCRLALTGTPITNEPLDIFSIALFFDGGKTFGDNEWKFKQRFYVKSGFGWYLKRGSKERLGKIINQISYYVHEDDVLTLPPKRYVVEHCKMTGIQRRKYKKLLEEWELEISSGEDQELRYVIAQIEKCRQISSGFYLTPADENGTQRTVWMNSGKLKKMLSMMTDPDYLGNKDKVIIWCARTAEIMKLYKELRKKNIGCVKFHGSNKKLKERARIRFRDDPKIRVFIGQVDSGVGINELVVAKDAVYFSNSTKVVSRQQSERRNRRIGSEHHDQITYWDLLSENSIDHKIMNSVMSKVKLAEYIMRRAEDLTPLGEILA